MTTFIVLSIVAVILWAIVYGIRQIFIVDDKTYITTMAAEQKPKPKERPLIPAEREALRQAEESLDWDTADLLLQRQYKGPLPYEVMDGRWSNIYPDIYSTKVAGINFRKAAAKQYAGITFPATIIADPKNEYDENAIKVIHSESKKHLGFIPADETEDVRHFLDGHLPHRNCRVHIDEGEDIDDETGKTRTYYTAKIAIKRTNKQWLKCKNVLPPIPSITPHHP